MKGTNVCDLVLCNSGNPQHVLILATAACSSLLLLFAQEYSIVLMSNEAGFCPKHVESATSNT